MGLTPWVRHTPERAMNKKLRAAGFAARGLDDAGICQVAYDDSDGFVSEATVEMLAAAHREKNWRRLVKLLEDEGRWTRTDGGWLIHDYQEFNFTREYWMAEKEKKRAAGRASGRARAPTPVQTDDRTPVETDVGTDAPTACAAQPLRFASLGKPPQQQPRSVKDVTPDAAAAGKLASALEVLYRRRPGPTRNPKNHHATIIAFLLEENAETIALLDWSREWDAVELADWIEPVQRRRAAPKPAPKPPPDEPRSAIGWFPGCEPKGHPA